MLGTGSAGDHARAGLRRSQNVTVYGLCRFQASSKPRAAAATARRPGPAGRLLAADFAACLLLLIQYLLGMVVNLYVTVGGQHPGAAAHSYFTGAASGLAWVIPDGPGWAAAHAAFGLALVAAAFASLALTWRQDSRPATATSALGALAILGAAFNGVSFLNYGHAYSSMIVSGLWALALACYITGLFRTARRLSRGLA